METKNILTLTDELFLGKGNHKEVYMHPINKSICVKILYKTPDTDFDREMKYRHALGKRAEEMTLLTKYFGTAETNKGTGYLFENVLDFDGQRSKTLLEHLENPQSTEDLIKLLLDFKKVFIEEKFVAAGMDPDNFLVQRISTTERKIRIIDNIGTSATFPILYYSDFLMSKRAKKYWKRFVKEIQIDHSEVITRKIAEILLNK